MKVYVCFVNHGYEGITEPQAVYAEEKKWRWLGLPDANKATAQPANTEKWK